jgi:hypothetical protein
MLSVPRIREPASAAGGYELSSGAGEAVDQNNLLRLCWVLRQIIILHMYPILQKLISMSILE